MSWNADDFVQAVDDADFEKLFGSDDKIVQFLDFVRDHLDDGEEKIVVRCAVEEQDGDVLYPFYVWLVYNIFTDGEFLGLAFKEFYIPKEGETSSYYSTPVNLKGRKFFPIVLE